MVKFSLYFCVYVSVIVVRNIPVLTDLFFLDFVPRSWLNQIIRTSSPELSSSVALHDFFTSDCCAPHLSSWKLTFTDSLMRFIFQQWLFMESIVTVHVWSCGVFKGFIHTFFLFPPLFSGLFAGDEDLLCHH